MSTIMTFNADEILIKDKALKDYLNDLGCLDNNLPIGVPIPYSGNGEIPVGFLLCNGASVLRTAYPDLFAVIGTLYGAIDDEHFNLPNLNGRFIEGNETAGTVKEAGLPNITATANASYGSGGSYAAFFRNAEGAISLRNTGYPLSNVALNTNYLAYTTVGFDASRSNPIYGNSDTVQPPSITMRWIIKAFKGASTDSTDLEITQVANEVAEKANMDLSNLSEVGRKYFFPSDTYIIVGSSDTKILDSYTAPANGFAWVRINLQNVATPCRLLINSKRRFQLDTTTNSLNATGFFVPLKTGDIVSLDSTKGFINELIFYYAEGEV